MKSFAICNNRLYYDEQEQGLLFSRPQEFMICSNVFIDYCSTNPLILSLVTILIRTEIRTESVNGEWSICHVNLSNTKSTMSDSDSDH